MIDQETEKRIKAVEDDNKVLRQQVKALEKSVVKYLENKTLKDLADNTKDNSEKETKKKTKKRKTAKKNAEKSKTGYTRTKK